MRLRTVSSLAALVAVAAIALAGCSGAATPSVSAGPSSSLVKADGAFGAEPKVTFPTPLVSAKTQCSVLKPGTGPTLSPTGSVLLDYTLYETAKGTRLGASSYAAGKPSLITASFAQLPGVGLGLSCANAGSRVAIVVGTKDGYAAASAGANVVSPPSSDSTIVVVADVYQVLPGRADGSPALTRDGFPAVVLGPDGRPGISIPHTSAPTMVGTETLRAGGGAKLQANDIAVVHYTGVDWTANTVVGSSWATGSPVFAQLVTGGSTDLPAQLLTELVGVRVGSQIGVELPADSASGSSASFYVVDVLGVVGT